MIRIPSRLLSRRAFVGTGTKLAATGLVIPHAVRSADWFGQYDQSLRQEMQSTADPTTIRAIALAAIDAAKSAGATYADVRLTRRVEQRVSNDRHALGISFGMHHAEETEQHGIGVRVLVNGMWGFSASPYWTLGEAARLATDATAQARENAKAMPAQVELVPAPVTTGSWKTPYEIDPFSISLEEKMAMIQDAEYVTRYGSVDHTEEGFVDAGAPHHPTPVRCTRVEETLATIEGTYLSQQYYTTEVVVGIDVRGTSWVVRNGVQMLNNGQSPSPALALNQQSLQGTGWEVTRGLPAFIEKMVDTTIADLYTSNAAPPAPKYVNVGRYPMVADASSMGALLAVSLQALDLDRVLGDEVNAGGSSWIGADPVAILGQFQFGSPLLSVSMNRGLAKGPTQTQWDAEGVAALDTPLIQHGVVYDFPTTRATASVLAPAYQRLGRRVQSNGCSAAMSSFDQQCVGMPDMVMAPGRDAIGFEQLVSSVSRGYAIVGLQSRAIETDMQLRQLVARPELREIVNGRLGALVRGGELIIDAAELWKDLTAIGGAESQTRWSAPEDDVNPASYQKGQPRQTLSFAVQAVPGLFANLAVTDGGRRV